jgi:hypothetical protein
MNKTNKIIQKTESNHALIIRKIDNKSLTYLVGYNNNKA